MSTAVHCDNALCETWSSTGYAAEAGFLRVTWAGKSYDLCCVDCLLRFFAHVPSVERIPNG